MRNTAQFSKKRQKEHNIAFRRRSHRMMPRGQRARAFMLRASPEALATAAGEGVAWGDTWEYARGTIDVSVGLRPKAIGAAAALTVGGLTAEASPAGACG